MREVDDEDWHHDEHHQANPAADPQLHLERRLLREENCTDREPPRRLSQSTSGRKDTATTSTRTIANLIMSCYLSI
jgi:hypothetical protein